MLAGLAGCSWFSDSDASRPPEEPLPKLRDVLTARPSDPLPPPTVHSMRLEVYRLEVADDADLLELRKLVKRGTIAMPSRDLWRANGMIVGLLGPKELAELQKMSLPILARGQMTIAATRPWNVLTLYPPPPPLPPPAPPSSPSSSTSSSSSSDRNPAPGPVMEFYRPDGRSRPVTLTDGRRQFLFSVHPSGLGASVLTLVPHLNQPEFSFTPRLSSDVQLDGRRFDELALTVYLPAGQTLLLMPSLPPPLSPPFPVSPEGSSNDPTESSPAVSADSSNESPSGAPSSQPLLGVTGLSPNDMGHFWLTGAVGSRASQAILLIRSSPTK